MQWASKTDGTVSGGEYSAKYWAQQAADIVTGDADIPPAGIAVSNGTSWLASLSIPAGVLVGTAATQTLTGKTITYADNTLTGVAGLNAVQTLTNKTISYADNNLTGVAGLVAVQTLTNKTISFGDNNLAGVQASVFDITTNAAEANALTDFVTATFSDKVIALGNTGTALSLNASQGGFYTATLNGSCTITLSAANAVSGRTTSFALRLTNDGTGGRSVALAGGTFRTPGGSLGRTTAANAVDIWFFVTRDGGANWDVNIPMKNIQTL